jgi:Ca2+-transporting ATPase
VLFQLFNVFHARFLDRSSFHKLLANRWVWLAILSSAALQVAVVHLPFLQRPFRATSLGARDWLVCTAVASAVLWIEEAKKLALRLLRAARRSKDRGAGVAQHAA